MADAIDILTDEHRLIEQMLGSLETFVESLGRNPAEERQTVRAYADFFRGFVDDCHHGKEEGHLFVRMGAGGFSANTGPVAAMLSEQGEGREHLSVLAGIGGGSGPLSANEQELVRGHSLGYITRILSHMKRENEILFPVVRHTLPSFVLKELADEFEEFESKVLTRGRHDGLIQTSRRLMTRYPSGRRQA